MTAKAGTVDGEAAESPAVIEGAGASVPMAEAPAPSTNDAVNRGHAYRKKVKCRAHGCWYPFFGCDYCQRCYQHEDLMRCPKNEVR